MTGSFYIIGRRMQSDEAHARNIEGSSEGAKE